MRKCLFLWLTVYHLSFYCWELFPFKNIKCLHHLQNLTEISRSLGRDSKITRSFFFLCVCVSCLWWYTTHRGLTSSMICFCRFKQKLREGDSLRFSSRPEFTCLNLTVAWREREKKKTLGSFHVVITVRWDCFLSQHIRPSRKEHGANYVFYLRWRGMEQGRELIHPADASWPFCGQAT